MNGAGRISFRRKGNAGPRAHNQEREKDDRGAGLHLQPRRSDTVVFSRIALASPTTEREPVTQIVSSRRASARARAKAAGREEVISIGISSPAAACANSSGSAARGCLAFVRIR